MELEDSEYALSWDGHIEHVRKAFNKLLQSNELCDVTLYADGQKIGAHKVLLSSCSMYFNQLFKDFKDERPIVVLKGIKYDILKYILKFIYNGEVNVEIEQLNQFLDAATFLKIHGLTDNNIKRKRKSSLISETDNTVIVEESLRPAIETEEKRRHVGKRFYEITPYKPAKVYKADENTRESQLTVSSGYSPDFTKAPQICKYSMETQTKVGEWFSDYEYSQSHLVENQSPLPESIDDPPLMESVDKQNPISESVPSDIVKCEYTSEPDSDIVEISSFHQDDFANSLDAEIDNSVDDDMLEKHLMKTSFASIDENGLFLCRICNKSFAKKDSLKKHFAVHSNNTVCTICGRMLSRKTHLIRHYLNVHGISWK